MIGKKSIYAKINVSVQNQPYEVKIQANRRGGIIDIILPKTQLEPIKPVDTSKGKAVREYNTAKREYDRYMRGINFLRSQFLNKYQGRQINGYYVKETISHFLFNLLNK